VPPGTECRPLGSPSFTSQRRQRFARLAWRLRLATTTFFRAPPAGVPVQMMKAQPIEHK
jgi:hypothetical protein